MPRSYTYFKLAKRSILSDTTDKMERLTVRTQLSVRRQLMTAKQMLPYVIVKRIRNDIETE